jgi:hypothetical protein
VTQWALYILFHVWKTGSAHLVLIWTECATIAGIWQILDMPIDLVFSRHLMQEIAEWPLCENSASHPTSFTMG